MFRYTLFYKYISKQHNIVSIIYMLMQHKKSDNVYTQMPGQVHFPPFLSFSFRLSLANLSKAEIKTFISTHKKITSKYCIQPIYGCVGDTINTKLNPLRGGLVGLGAYAELSRGLLQIPGFVNT